MFLIDYINFNMEILALTNVAVVAQSPITDPALVLGRLLAFSIVVIVGSARNWVYSQTESVLTTASQCIFI